MILKEDFWIYSLIINRNTIGKAGCDGKKTS